MAVNTQSCHLDSQKVSQLARKSGFTPKLDAKPDQSLFDGLFSNHSEANGLRIHAVDALELSNHISSVNLMPSVNVGVLLKGKVDFCLGADWHHFDADSNGPVCFASCVPVPTPWQRKMVKHNHVCKVVVSGSFDWLQDRDPESRLISKLQTLGANVWQWPYDEKVEQLAQSLMALSQETSLHSNLTREARATELLLTGLEKRVLETTQSKNAKPLINRNITRKGEAIRNHLETYIVRNPKAMKVDLSQLENQLGMSCSTLQRSFKKAFAITISDYVRVRKLEIARDSLSNGRTSIGEAAFMAGYGHASNFSKAFKLAFGVSPGDYIKLGE
ncbi:Xylose operon regulatory protein [Thalassocella blandensis]|nr:Xylose operon regulatory protein [Thalassocella blandensis]